MVKNNKGEEVRQRGAQTRRAEEAAQKVDVPPAKKKAGQPKSNKRKMPESVPAEVRLSRLVSACCCIPSLACSFSAWRSGPSPRAASSLLHLFSPGEVCLVQTATQEEEDEDDYELSQRDVGRTFTVDCGEDGMIPIVLLEHRRRQRFLAQFQVRQQADGGRPRGHPMAVPEPGPSYCRCKGGG